MEEAVGGDGAPAVRRPDAAVVGEAAAGLLDDHLHGGQVPQRHDGVEPDVDSALGHEHVRPEVAEGAVDIGLDPIVSLWDLAAVQVIVEEAGGRFTDFSGVATPDGGSAISTNGLLHDAVLAYLRTGGTSGE